MPVIRGLEIGDHPALLRMNAANAPAVARLDTAELRRLASIGGSHLVAVDADAEHSMLGYLLAFASSDPYDGEEFCHFSAHLPQAFLYIDQLAVERSGRRQGVGRKLYESLAALARQRALGLMCCEVNVHPPNADSLAFHLRMGFAQVGAMTTSDRRTVALLTRATPGINPPT